MRYIVTLLFLIGMSGLVYNIYSEKWEYKAEGDVLKYNIYEKEWSYEPEESVPVYNYYELKWEYKKKGE